VDEGLHVNLVSCSGFLSVCVAFSLVPQQRFHLAILLLFHAFFRSLHHILVQFLPTRPLSYGGAAHGAGDQPHLVAHARPQRIGEGHAGAHAADFACVNVDVEGLVCRFPLEVGGEAEDGRVGAALRRKEAVPVIAIGGPDDSAATGHVALA